MLDFLKFITDQSVMSFLLLLTRFTTIIAFATFFSHQTIPTTVKGALGFWLTLVFYPLVDQTKIPITTDALFLGIISEATFGFLVGLFLSIITAAFSFAGESISQAIGLNTASIMDPQSGINSQVIGLLISNFTLIVFLEINGHHWILEFIAASLSQIPLGGFVLAQKYLDYLLYATTHLFTLSLMVAFPVMAVSFLTNIVYGLLMRTMPNFNLLVIGQPATLLLGMIVLTSVMSAIGIIYRKEMSLAFEQIATLFTP